MVSAPTTPDDGRPRGWGECETDRFFLKMGRKEKNLTLTSTLGLGLGLGDQYTNVRTSRIVLDSGQPGTCPNTLGGVEKTGLCG